MNKSVHELIVSMKTIQGEDFTYSEDALELESKRLESNRASLSIRILTIFGVLLGTLAFIVFVAISGLLKSEIFMIITGCLSVAGALFIKIDEEYTLVMDTFRTTIYLIGLALISTGLVMLESPYNINNH